ncbi:MAG: hypothetical protein JRI46_04330 [Deltaproteobacteria bacterium]|nr:hypothetical protein [Deltaproteobacteria bacterium]
MTANKVVIHYKNGKILKGTIADFLPTRPTFHLIIGGIDSEEVKEIPVEDLKAVFFVKDFIGDKNYKEIKGFGDRPRSGKRVKAMFKDGEAIFGYTHAINFDHPGLFLVPADPNCNNERVFAVYSSLTGLEVDGSPVDLRKVRRG